MKKKMIIWKNPCKNSPFGNKQDGPKLELSFYREVLYCQVILPVVSQGLVERAVLLSRDVIGVASPGFSLSGMMRM
jgi:hypothetical protein